MDFTKPDHFQWQAITQLKAFSGVHDCISWAEGLHYLIRNGDCITSDLSQAKLTESAVVMVSAAVAAKPVVNSALCSPARFHAMPSIAYRLAQVAAGDAVCGISLFPVSAHDVVAAHALLRGAGGILINEKGAELTYLAGKMDIVSQRCLGGALLPSREMCSRDWSGIFVGAE